MKQLHRELVLHNIEALTHEARVEAECRPGDNLFHIEIDTSSEAVAMSMEVLRLMMAFTGRIYTAIDRAQIESTSQAKVTELRNAEKAVAMLYWHYRDQGIRHRRACQITAQASEVCQRLKWGTVEVNYCQRCFPREYFMLNEPRKKVLE